MSSQVLLTREVLLAELAGEVVGDGLTVMLQSFWGGVLAVALGTTEIPEGTIQCDYHCTNKHYAPGNHHPLLKLSYFQVITTSADDPILS